MTQNPQNKKRIVKRKRRDDTDVLYDAAIKYIKNRGGSALVIGGVALVTEPLAPKYNYGLMIRITGKKPENILP